MPIHPLLLLVLAQRLLELFHARGNTRRLLAQGAVEVGAGHYPLIVALHAGWWAALAATVPPAMTARPLPVAALALLMVARAWVLVSLGRFWTTRIITLPGAPLVRRGPYRLMAHPNYWIVATEIALVPLAFDAIGLAVAFSALNGALLAWRVAVEDRALNARGSFDPSA
ncbi:MAG TPA: isoprenylcysteine carboxylmethyltransferase family protein [Magnetospirillum sp.]|nr:isoprenylcysteine carboxylmethyltransferase family protein [Magnetospirillum sp.]